MSLLLDLLYAFGLLLASPWIAYRLFRTRSWGTVPARFGFGLPSVSAQSVWLHGSSVGEVTLLKPLVALLEREYPELDLVITSYTNTGLIAASSAYPNHRVLPFPLDFSLVVDRFIRRMRPRAIVIVESDFWPNFLLSAKRRQVPVCVVNGKLSQKSARLHRRMKLVSPLIGSCESIAAQNDEYAQRFRDLGIASERITVTGNMKYDLTDANPASDGEARSALGYGADTTIIVGASLHEREDVDLLQAFTSIRRDQPTAALIIVPRYPEEASTVLDHVGDAGFAGVRRTELDRADGSDLGPDTVLVVDTVGELRRIYAASDIAFVGGSLYFRGANKGGHNLMEPSIAGLPVLFGPYNYSFKETANALIAADGGRLVNDADELEAVLRQLVEDPGLRADLGRRAREVILQGQGATARNIRLLRPLLDVRPPLAAVLPSEENAASGHSLRNP